MVKKAFLWFLFSSAVCSLLAQTTVDVTSLGTINYTCVGYSPDPSDKTWIIDIPGNNLLVLDYVTNVHINEEIFVYSIDDSGVATFQAGLSGSQSGRIQSLYCNGKMKIVFDGYDNFNCSTIANYGFEIKISKLQSINFSYDATGNLTNRIINLQSGNASFGAAAREASVETFIDIIDKQEVKIYPNPTKGQIRVEITSLPDGSEGCIVIYDSAGKIVAQQQTIASDNSLDISQNTDGIYIMRIRIGEEESTWKIIKN
ncbi:MAG: T9SS type A sorting domain-containing protein [Dysgonamonadaceae bacterium]|jgi:hypothetical protein|nr:T9SS type A sorting domain-containing protein [Dysgonamonadaceae bacterium]